MWTASNRYCITNKIKEVSFKIIHRIYPVNQAISRFHNVDLNCTFCEQEEESICHLFLKCRFTYLFWTKLEDLFEILTGIKINLKIKDIILTYHGKKLKDKELFLLNLFLLLGKYYIHKCKWIPKKPYFHEFKIETKYYMQLLQYMENKKAIKTLEYYNSLKTSI